MSVTGKQQACTLEQTLRGIRWLASLADDLSPHLVRQRSRGKLVGRIDTYRGCHAPFRLLLIK